MKIEERMTKRIADYVYYTQGMFPETLPAECESHDIRKILKRLADYEDTELLPAEILEHEAMFKAYRHVCGGLAPEVIEKLNERQIPEASGVLDRVVRCKDCCYLATCIHHMHDDGGIFGDDDYCSQGERETYGAGCHGPEYR